MNHKKGDTVRIKGTEWYKANRNQQGTITAIRHQDFIQAMSKYCGREATIVEKRDFYYKLNIDNRFFKWTDEMLEDQP